MKLNLILTEELKKSMPHTIETIYHLTEVKEEINSNKYYGDSVIVCGDEDDFIKWLLPHKKIAVGLGRTADNEFYELTVKDAISLIPIKVEFNNYVQESIFSSRHFQFNDYYQVNQTNIQYVNLMAGIPIDEKWCIRLGFDVRNRFHSSCNYDWIAEMGHFIIRSMDNKVHVSMRFDGYTIGLDHIKFVHELQNIYYWMYGAELVIEKDVD